ncbi:hypothetical protein K3727_11155 [Rhodobacteraceae bacterium M382]|nr:hypothetical protein K3727_11155 [Rhodobacteraceae bacterium M382]
MDDSPQPELPANLRFLRVLVTVLTAVMIVGVVIVVGLLVTRLKSGPAQMALPDQIVLPDGTRPQAFTQGATWFAVVTHDDRILVFSREDGRLVQDIAVSLPD